MKKKHIFQTKDYDKIKIEAQIHSLFKIVKKPKKQKTQKKILIQKNQKILKKFKKNSKISKKNKKSLKNAKKAKKGLKTPLITKKKNFFFSKILFTQYTLILQTRAILSLSILAISLTNYEYYHTQKSKYKYISYTISFISIILNIMSVFLYWTSIHFWGKYIRFLGWMNSNTNIFFYYGLDKIFFVSFCLGIHVNPFKELFEDYDIFEIEAFNPKSKTNSTFVNSINDVILIIKFISHFLSIIDCFIRICRFARPSSNNILNRSKTKILFIFKAILNENFLLTTFMVFFLSVLLFSVIIRISENGFINHIKKKDFEIENINLKPIFYYYKNCFWNIVITITTIGYGDLSVNSVLSKILQFFISITGFIIISFLIVALTEFVKFDNIQEKVFDLFNAVHMKEEMKHNFDIALKKFILKTHQRVKDKRKLVKDITHEGLKLKKDKRIFKIDNFSAIESSFENSKSQKKSLSKSKTKIEINDEIVIFIKNELKLKEFRKSKSKIESSKREDCYKSTEKIELLYDLKSNSSETEREEIFLTPNYKKGHKRNKSNKKNTSFIDENLKGKILLNDYLKEKNENSKDNSEEENSDLISIKINKKLNLSNIKPSIDVIKKKDSLDIFFSNNKKKIKSSYNFKKQKENFEIKINNHFSQRNLGNNILNSKIKKKYLETLNDPENIIDLQKFNKSQLKLVNRIKDIIFFYNKKYKKEMFYFFSYMDKYKIIRNDYFYKFGPKSIDSLKFLVGILDDILDDFIFFFCVKNEKILVVIKNMKEKDKHLFNYVVYLFPYAKMCYDKNNGIFK